MSNSTDNFLLKSKPTSPNKPVIEETNSTGGLLSDLR